MSARRVEQALREARAPGELEAGARSWDVVRAGFERTERPHRQRRFGRRAALAAGLAVLAGAVVLSPAGAKVADFVGNALDTTPGVPDAKPALVSLPAPGRLLVESHAGAWVVQHDGSKRLLGPFHDPTWSPHGLYVAAARGHQLVAVDPLGRVRWTVDRGGAVSTPAWAPSGLMIAYRSGRDVRVVEGDGSNDRLLAGGTHAFGLAWRPGPGYELAYSTGSGVRVVDAVSRRRLWQARGLDPPGRLEWTPDGRRLVTSGPSGIRVLSDGGRELKQLRMPAGWVLRDSALAPAGNTLVIVREQPASGRSAVVQLSMQGVRWHPVELFSGAGDIDRVRWSPDGRWLLLAWRDANQWLFVRSSATRGVRAYSGIAASFDPAHPHRNEFPEPLGWVP